MSCIFTYYCIFQGTTITQFLLNVQACQSECFEVGAGRAGKTLPQFDKDGDLVLPRKHQHHRPESNVVLQIGKIHSV